MWNSLLEISGTGNCDDSNTDQTKGDEYHKACIKKDIETYYDLNDFWNSDYWKTYYEGKLASADDKEKFQKLGSWEKFREVCTKGFDELMKKGDWSRLSGGLGLTSSDTTKFQDSDELSIGDCYSTYSKHPSQRNGKKNNNIHK